MSRVVRHTVHAAALRVGLPLAGLFAYDWVAVRPHVAEVEVLLARAEPLEASPPQRVRDLIDAGVASPDAYGARLALAHVDGTDRRSVVGRHVRELLWRFLLPLHLDDSAMYGLIVSQAYNGTDRGLAALARREHRTSLDALSPLEAARTVAVIQGSYVLRDHRRVEARAEWLLARTGHAR